MIQGRRRLPGLPIFITATLLMAVLIPASAQHKYWVFFRDKNAYGFNPFAYFDPLAIERRISKGIPLYDSTDLPVNSKFVEEIGKIADSLGCESRWFNAVGAWASPGEIERISKLPFVTGIEEMRMMSMPAAMNGLPNDTTEIEGFLHEQTSLLQGEKFRGKKITGKGVRIAILDVGFIGAEHHPAFRHLYQNGQIIKTHDFLKNRDDVYHTGLHGAMVMGCIAGKTDSFPGHEGMAYLGLAPGVELLLARTERELTERIDEEDAWVAAAEWADRNGAKIISSSLGYSFKRYFVKDMNGRVSRVAKGAAIAFGKGILVVTSAGNDGENEWKYICTPADNDSVLTIGGVDPIKKYHIGFSSYGPNTLGHIKPNLSASGQVMTVNRTYYTLVEGTSFSCPLVAGFAACVWQMHPDWTNQQLFEKLEQSGHLYPYYDYAHGYGMPQASYFTGASPKKKDVFKYSLDDGKVSLEFKDSSKGKWPRLLYYHVANKEGLISHYEVIQLKDAGKYEFTVNKDELAKASVLRIHYRDQTEEIPLESLWKKE